MSEGNASETLCCAVAAMDIKRDGHGSDSSVGKNSRHSATPQAPAQTKVVEVPNGDGATGSGHANRHAEPQGYDAPRKGAKGKNGGTRWQPKSSVSRSDNTGSAHNNNNHVGDKAAAGQPANGEKVYNSKAVVDRPAAAVATPGAPAAATVSSGSADSKGDSEADKDPAGAGEGSGEPGPTASSSSSSSPAAVGGGDTNSSVGGASAHGNSNHQSQGYGYRGGGRGGMNGHGPLRRGPPLQRSSSNSSSTSSGSYSHQTGHHHHHHHQGAPRQSYPPHHSQQQQHQQPPPPYHAMPPPSPYYMGPGVGGGIVMPYGAAGRAMPAGYGPPPTAYQPVSGPPPPPPSNYRGGPGQRGGGGPAQQQQAPPPPPPPPQGAGQQPRYYHPGGYATVPPPPPPPPVMPMAYPGAAANLASTAMGYYHTQQQLLPTPMGLTIRANLMKMSQQEAREYLAAMAVQQIEYFFSVENLARDTYLRAHLDEAGWVPLAFVCNFPSVASFAADYLEIIKTLKDSLLLEYDDENETIRLKEGATRWLVPSPSGSLGVPRWLKQRKPGMEGAAMAAYPPHPHAAYYAQPQQPYPYYQQPYYQAGPGTRQAASPVPEPVPHYPHKGGAGGSGGHYMHSGGPSSSLGHKRSSSRDGSYSSGGGGARYPRGSGGHGKYHHHDHQPDRAHGGSKGSSASSSASSGTTPPKPAAAEGEQQSSSSSPRAEQQPQGDDGSQKVQEEEQQPASSSSSSSSAAAPEASTPSKSTGTVGTDNEAASAEVEA